MVSAGCVWIEIGWELILEEEYRCRYRMYLPLEYYMYLPCLLPYWRFSFLFVSGFFLFFLVSLLYLRYLPDLPMLLPGEEALEIC